MAEMTLNSSKLDHSILKYSKAFWNSSVPMLQMPLWRALTCSLLFISFEFVKAVGNSITKVALPIGQEATARVMKHVAGHGPVYVRALQKIHLSELEVASGVIRFFYGVRGLGMWIINRWFRCDKKLLLTCNILILTIILCSPFGGINSSCLNCIVFPYIIFLLFTKFGHFVCFRLTVTQRKNLSTWTP